MNAIERLRSVSLAIIVKPRLAEKTLSAKRRLQKVNWCLQNNTSAIIARELDIRL